MKVAVDAVRYHLFREMPHGADGDVALTGLLTRYNADLANDLGNALNRALAMVARNFDGVVPDAGVEASRRQDVEERIPNAQRPMPNTPPVDLPRLAAEVVAEAEAAYAEFRVQQALLAAGRRVGGIDEVSGEQAARELARRVERGPQG